jgi:hypothetical protein
LNELFEVKTTGKLDEIKISILKQTVYNHIVNQIYLLSAPFAAHKRKFRKELFKISKTDFETVLLIVEQVFDYWRYIKKLIALLGQGATLRQTHGERFTWKAFESDSTGNPLIKPRYDFTTKLSNN